MSCTNSQPVKKIVSICHIYRTLAYTGVTKIRYTRNNIVNNQPIAFKFHMDKLASMERAEIYK